MRAKITSTKGTREGTMMECLEWHKRTGGEAATIEVEAGDWYTNQELPNDGKTAKQIAEAILTDMAKAIGEGLAENAACEPEWLRDQAFAIREVAREAENIGL
jgi:hypothetical protein